jgi:AraC-like DNA-binding protein
MADDNRINLDTTNRFLRGTLLSLVPKPGYVNTGIPGLGIVRHDEPTGIIRCVYNPKVILMVQGKKRSIIGTEEIIWTKNQYMFIGVDLPSEGRILAASPKEPCLMIMLNLLQGPLGNRLRMIHTQGSKNYQIAQAILWLKNNYTKPLRINELAKLAYMAPSTFRRHFQQLTTMTPLQYQKRLRLYESQRLMLAERIDATHATYSVGYESINQFNREYKRMFGEPPGKNVKRLLTR